MWEEERRFTGKLLGNDDFDFSGMSDSMEEQLGTLRRGIHFDPR